MASIYHERPTPGQMQRLGERIRSIRMALGLSQPGFAQALNMSQPAVSAWELGKRLPEPEHLKAVAALTPDPKAFLGWLSDTSPEVELIEVPTMGKNKGKTKDNRRAFTNVHGRKDTVDLKALRKELDAALENLRSYRELVQAAEAAIMRAGRMVN